MIVPDLCGLLVAGGKSRRMGMDKAALETADGPLWWRTYALLASVCSEAVVGIRPGQTLPGSQAVTVTTLEDQVADAGPIAGILRAFIYRPEAAWLVLACDLPLLDQITLDTLIAARDPDQLVTAYNSSYDGKPEPLCAIYEPKANAQIGAALANERSCPRRFLIDTAAVKLIDLPNPHALENANTPEDLLRIKSLTL